jgi:hypothetical protein
MVGRQILSTSDGCRRTGAILLIHGAGTNEAYDEAQQHTDNREQKVFSCHCFSDDSKLRK